MLYMNTKIRQLAAMIAFLGLIASPLALRAQQAPAGDTSAPASGEEKKDASSGDEANKEEKKDEQKDETKDGENKPAEGSDSSSK